VSYSKDIQAAWDRVQSRSITRVPVLDRTGDSCVRGSCRFPHPSAGAKAGDARRECVMRVAYVYAMRDDPHLVDVAPQHAAYWQRLDLSGYEGGPFEDRSGRTDRLRVRVAGRRAGLRLERSVRRPRPRGDVVAQAMDSRAFSVHG
jgi:hypothetical protein